MKILKADEIDYVTYIQIHKLEVHYLLKAITEFDLLMIHGIRLFGFITSFWRVFFTSAHHRRIHQLGEHLRFELARKFGISWTFFIIGVTWHVNKTCTTERESNYSI